MTIPTYIIEHARSSPLVDAPDTPSMVKASELVADLSDEGLVVLYFEAMAAGHKASFTVTPIKDDDSELTEEQKDFLRCTMAAAVVAKEVVRRADAKAEAH